MTNSTETTKGLRAEHYGETVEQLKATEAVQSMAAELPTGFEIKRGEFMAIANREFHHRHQGPIPARLHIGGVIEAIEALRPDVHFT